MCLSVFLKHALKTRNVLKMVTSLTWHHRIYVSHHVPILASLKSHTKHSCQSTGLQTLLCSAVRFHACLSSSPPILAVCSAHTDSIQMAWLPLLCCNCLPQAGIWCRGKAKQLQYPPTCPYLSCQGPPCLEIRRLRNPDVARYLVCKSMWTALC